MAQNNSEPSKPSNAPAPRRRRRLRRLAIALGVVIGLVLGAILLAPTVLSSGWVRTRVAKTMQDELEAPVEIADLSLGWFSGVHLQGLVIGNPPGFDLDEPAIRLEDMEGDVSFLRLLAGQLDVSGTVRGLRVRVHQRADGSSNLQTLFGGKVVVEKEGRPPRQPPPPERGTGGANLDDVRLDVQLVDGRVDITHESAGLLESLQDIQARIHKPFGSSDLEMTLDTRLRRPDVAEEGRIALVIDVDTTMQRPLELKYDVNGVDLARYRPLMATFVAQDQVTELGGVVAGNGRAFVDVDAKSADLTGQLTVDRPRFAGDLFGGMSIAAPRWLLQPNVKVEAKEGDAPPVIQADRLHCDLGFATMDGMPAAEASALNGDRPSLGLKFTLDLGALGRFGGPLAALEGSAGKVQGSTALAVVPDAFEPATWKEKLPELLAADVSARLDHVEVQGQSIDGLDAHLTLHGGTADVTTDANVGGGPLTLTAQLDAAKQQVVPATMKLDWKGGTVQAGAVEALRYAVPVLAGLGGQANVDFSSGIRCQLDLQGPLLPGTFDDTIDWLEQWRGAGELHLSDGSFTPAGALQQLFALAGESGGKASFDSVGTQFQLEGGFIETALLQLSKKTTGLGMKGRTNLATGELEYTIDLSQLLAQHKDGKKVLDALGGTLPVAKLGGTVTDPQLAMPNFAEQLLQGGLQKAAGEALQKGIERGLGEILGRDKKKGDKQ